jgi:predicted enzyme related to lactoylglutathione lyase
LTGGAGGRIMGGRPPVARRLGRGTGVPDPIKEESMIKGVHTMFYSSEPEALRAFLRDKLRFPFTDVGEGWLIFDLPEADMGCHPADPGKGAPSGTHDISFYCDDVEKTMADLKGRGVEFTGPITDQGYGLVTHFKMPGGLEVQLYQPRYAKKASPA